MLTIRLKRIGRRNLAQYRVIVQDKRFSPKSGKIVENLGSYDPYSKKAEINVESAKKYLDNGAQPSPRVQKILEDQKVSLPKWVVKAPKKEGKTKNPDKKLRKDQPQTAETAPTEAPAEPDVEQAESPTEEVAVTEEVATTEESAEADKTDEVTEEEPTKPEAEEEKAEEVPVESEPEEEKTEDETAKTA